MQLSDVRQIIQDTHARQLPGDQLPPIIDRLNAGYIYDAEALITNGILDLIWDIDNRPSQIINYMCDLWDGQLWAQIGRLSPATSSFPDRTRRRILYNYPQVYDVHAALDMLSTSDTHAHGMLLLRNIMDRASANHRSNKHNHTRPIQYAVTLPNASIDAIKLLVQGGAYVGDVFQLDTIVNREIRARIEEEILRLLADNEDNYTYLSMLLLVHFVEHKLSYISEGGMVRSLAQDELVPIPPWPADRIWLQDYLSHKCNARQLPLDMPQFIVITAPLMQFIWAIIGDKLVTYPDLGYWNEFARPFLDICLRHTINVTLRMTLRPRHNPSPAHLHALNNYILECTGYASADEIRAVKKCIRRPQRLNWLEPYMQPT